MSKIVAMHVCYNSWCIFLSFFGVCCKSAVHITPGEFKTVGLFARLDLPSTLVYHGNGVFRKRSSIRRTGICENDDRCYDNHDISLPEFFSYTQIKMTGDCSVFKSLRGSYNLEGKHLIRFLMIRSETSIFKFLRHQV